jgi:hypothetical protein
MRTSRADNSDHQLIAEISYFCSAKNFNAMLCLLPWPLEYLLSRTAVHSWSTKERNFR